MRSISLFIALSLALPTLAQTPPLAEPYLTSGRLTEGQTALAAHLKTNPADDQARFGLAAVQTVHAVQRLATNFHRFGLRTSSFAAAMPFFRLPIGENPNPDAISYEDFRAIFQTWLDDMAAVDKTLAAINDPNVKLPLHVARVRLDLDNNGAATDAESLASILGLVGRPDPADARRRRAGAAPAPADLLITFDAADVHWLRGYTHFLSALAEMMLAYDQRELFERTAHVLFKNPTTPHEFLPGARPVADVGMGFDIVDVIAFIHLFNFPVKEADRMPRALRHYQSMIAHSRQSWQKILAETDDDHEWIPSPRQTTSLPNMQVTEAMVQGWTEFLDLSDALLAGEKLIPFWRTRDGRGVNLSKVFTHPRPFDLVLWVQGTAATPYLENGPTIDAPTWQRLQRNFQGQFFTFAIWFN